MLRRSRLNRRSPPRVYAESVPFTDDQLRALPRSVDGRHWTTFSRKPDPAIALDMSGVSAKDGWFVAGPVGASIEHWDGQRWSPRARTISAVVAAAPLIPFPLRT